MPQDAFETEVYELAVPGRLIGKEIIDAEARRIGICRSVKIKFSGDKKTGLKYELFLTVKGLDVEFDIPLTDVDIIGNVIKLKMVARQADDLPVRDVIRLQEDVAGEIRARASRI